MLSFAQSAFASVYWTAAAAPAVGYVLPPAVTAGGSLTLKQTWANYAGCYVFVDAAVPADAASQERFARAVWALVAGLPGTRFAWVAGPAGPSGWPLGPTLAVTGPADSNGAATVRTLTRFELRNVAVAVPPGSTITPDLDGEAFTIAAPRSGSRAYLTVQRGATILDVITGPISVPLAGTAGGCLRLPLELGVTSGVPDLDHLDVGLRMFFRQTFGGDAGDSGGPFFLDSLRCPLFATPQISFAATLDPLAPLDQARTFLEFAATTAIGSYYRTNLGQGVTLAPRPGAALVFAERPPDSTGPGGAPLYLVPSGDFLLAFTAGDGATADTEATANMMCGLSGVEYLKIPPAPAVTLTFRPGKDAFAPAFNAGSAATAAGTTTLTSLATTAWAYVRLTTGAVEYCAQPDSSVLYSPPAASDPLYAPAAPLSALTYLTYLEVVSSALPADPPPTTSQSFPLLPYAGVGADRVADHLALETTVVGPARRTEIATMSASATAAEVRAASLPPGDVVGTTPQGLLATFAPDYSQVSKLVLARNADGSEVALKNIPRGSDLWTALQSNQLFLVVTNPDSVARYVVPGSTKLVADGWTFDLDPTTWRPLTDPHPTFLIFKFTTRPLAELAGQPASWALPSQFNHDPAAASTALTAFVTESQTALHKTDRYFISSVLNDPQWNGIVGFNCETPIDDWPAQLQGLAAGIDPVKLVGHHAGVHTTPVQTTTDSSGAITLSAQASSIFGLIDYESPDHIPAGPAPYDFKVLRLEVRIDNSHVASFASTIALQVNQLFGEPCALTGTSDNNLLLQGSYQQSAGQGSYVFLSQGDTLFSMMSAVIEAIDLPRVQFVTVGQPVAGNQAPIETRFLMWGTIDFRPLGAGGATPVLFDVLSFGHGPSDKPGTAGLAFSNLSVDMTVTPLGEDLPAAKSFAFDANHIAVDLATSQARDTSLYTAFPLQLTNVVQTDASSAPADLGYAPVSTPLDPAELTAPWFGLGLQLELGTLGSWAPTGSFVAGLLVAWCPSSSDKPKVFVGIHLPGLSGSRLQIGIEGPLDLTIKNIAFEAPGPPGQYVLWLQSIALSFFSLTFPPSGRTDLLLFAQAGEGGKRTLGWYAAYDKASGGSGAKPGTTARAGGRPLTPAARLALPRKDG